MIRDLYINGEFKIAASSDVAFFRSDIKAHSLAVGAYACTASSFISSFMILLAFCILFCFVTGFFLPSSSRWQKEQRAQGEHDAGKGNGAESSYEAGMDFFHFYFLSH